MEIKLKNLEKEKEFEQLETKLKQVMQNDGVEDYKEALEATMYGNVGGFARPTTSVGSRGVKEKDNGNSNGNGSVVNSAVGNNNNVNNITNINSNVGHLTVAEQEPKKDSMFGKNSMFGNNNKTENIEETITNVSKPSTYNPNPNTISNPTPVAQPQPTDPQLIDDDNLEMPTE